MKRPADFNPHDERNTKRCRKCGETKSVAEFPWDKRGWYSSPCSVCRSLSNSESRARVGLLRLGRRRRPTDWTGRELAKLRECINANMTSDEAAAQIGRSRKATQCQRIRQDLPPFRRKKPTGLRRNKWPAERVALLKQLRDRNTPFSVCAAVLSVTRNSAISAAHNHLKQEPRP